MARWLDWNPMWRAAAQRLERQTGEDLAAWNARVLASGAEDEPALRSWLAGQGVTGYQQTLLVFERLGYPGFLTASSEELVAGQFADRPQLRPILDAVLAAVESWPDLDFQARKTYVTLVTPRRTFALLAATTKKAFDVGLRWPGHAPGGRLLGPSPLSSAGLTVRFRLTAPEEVDDEVVAALRDAWQANR